MSETKYFKCDKCRHTEPINESSFYPIKGVDNAEWCTRCGEDSCSVCNSTADYDYPHMYHQFEVKTAQEAMDSPYDFTGWFVFYCNSCVGKGLHKEFHKGHRKQEKKDSKLNSLKLDKLLRNLDKICFDPIGYLANAELLKNDEVVLLYNKGICGSDRPEWKELETKVYQVEIENEIINLQELSVGFEEIREAFIAEIRQNKKDWEVKEPIKGSDSGSVVQHKSGWRSWRLGIIKYWSEIEKYSIDNRNQDNSQKRKGEDLDNEREPKKPRHDNVDKDKGRVSEIEIIRGKGNDGENNPSKKDDEKDAKKLVISLLAIKKITLTAEGNLVIEFNENGRIVPPTQTITTGHISQSQELQKVKDYLQKENKNSISRQEFDKIMNPNSTTATPTKNPESNHALLIAGGVGILVIGGLIVGLLISKRRGKKGQ